MASITLFERDDYEGAIEAAEHAFAGYPGCPPCVIIRALSFSRLGRRKEAWSDLKTAMPFIKEAYRRPIELPSAGTCDVPLLNFAGLSASAEMEYHVLQADGYR
jgi:hypothetical protein